MGGVGWGRGEGWEVEIGCRGEGGELYTRPFPGHSIQPPSPGREREWKQHGSPFPGKESEADLGVKLDLSHS